MYVVMTLTLLVQLNWSLVGWLEGFKTSCLPSHEAGVTSLFLSRLAVSNSRWEETGLVEKKKSPGQIYILRSLRYLLRLETNKIEAG